MSFSKSSQFGEKAHHLSLVIAPDRFAAALGLRGTCRALVRFALSASVTEAVHRTSTAESFDP